MSSYCRLLAKKSIKISLILLAGWREAAFLLFAQASGLQRCVRAILLVGQISAHIVGGGIANARTLRIRDRSTPH